MFENKIIELKESINDLYNLYLESDNKGDYITKIAKIFNIPVFKVLSNNYKIVSIDIDNLFIEIEDIRHGITYNATYTSNCDLFNYNGNLIRFIEVIEIDSEKYLKKVYHIGEDSPVISKMVFGNDERVLEFIKEESNDLNTFLDNGKKLTIRYLVNEDGNYVPLFTKTQKINYDDSFERVYTYDGVNYNTPGNLVDKSIFVDDNNLVYIVDDLVIKTPIAYLKGICFENTHADINKYKVNGINLNEFGLLSDKSVISSMIFKGIVEDELCLLEIYKNSECINIKYHTHNNVLDNEEDMAVLFENIELPILNEGKISVLEINSIISSLKQDIFTNMVINELNSFVMKLYLKDKVIEEGYDVLSPKTLIDKSFDLIAESILKYKKEYFELMDSEFSLVSGLNGKKK